MSFEKLPKSTNIPKQKPVSWTIAFVISWAGLKRRLLRALITMSGVILAIAFLSYMLIMENYIQAMILLNIDALNILLQRSGVDIFSGAQKDEMMMMLIGLSCLTCLVGICNSMLMSVTERIKEIGTLKCLGARDMFILKSYLIESSVQGIIGAILGMILGTMVATTISYVHYGNYIFSGLPAGAIAFSLVISFLIGALISIMASIAPAYIAAKKEPVEALRVEE